VASRLAAGDVVVRLSPPSPDSRSMDPGRLVAGFAEAVVGVIEASRPAGLFLSGGDTALAVLQRLGTRAVRLEREVGSGLVFGRLMGGITEGMPVVTKAGAFGPPNALLNLKSAISDAQEKVRR
jgi:D-threonate/D-erythronate kinase